MPGSKSKGVPSFGSLDELADFFDTHDMGDYWDQMPEAEFEVDISRRTHLFALDQDLVDEVADIAKLRKTSSERLVNAWVREKVLAPW